MIKITKQDENTFLVVIDNTTKHTVTLTDQQHHQINGNLTKEELIKKSFEFLLEREPKESILREFELPLIQQYFPKYGESMK